MVNVPLGESPHSMRLSAYGIDGDHIYRNTYTGKGVNDASKYGGRAKLLLDFEGASSSDGFGQFIFSLDYSEDDSDCCALATRSFALASSRLLSVKRFSNPSARALASARCPSRTWT